MKKSIIAFLSLLTTAFICGTSPSNAQSFYKYGIAQEPGGSVIKNKEISVRGDSVNTIYTFYAVLPENVDASTVRWYAEGGLEIVDQSATKVIVRSGNGTTYADKYSKYSNGELRLYVDRTNVVSEDCECAQLCDPVARFYLYFKKRFDIDGNPINGPECANAGDTVTFSVEPWNSLMLYGSYDSYVWTVEPSDYVKVGSQFYSADHSSTTFTLKEDLASVDGLKLTCKICSVTDDVNEKTLSDKPKEPTIFLVEGDTETLVTDRRICLPADATNMVLRISDYNPAFNYNLNASGWMCSDLGNGRFYFDVSRGEKELKLILRGGCGSQTFVYNVSRSLVEGLSLSDSCFTPEETVRLKLAGAGEGLDVRWSFADSNHNGWEIENGDVPMPSAKVGTGPAIVNVSSAVCNVGEKVSISLNVPPKKPEFVGDDYSCFEYAKNDNMTISLKDDAATASWTWSSKYWDFTEAGAAAKAGNSVVATPRGKYKYQTPITVTAVGNGGCPGVSSTLNVSPLYSKPELTAVSECGSPGSSVTLSASSPSYFSPLNYVWDFGGLTDSVGNSAYTCVAMKTVELTSPLYEGKNYEVSVRPYGTCNAKYASSTTAICNFDFEHKFTLYYELVSDDGDWGIDLAIKDGVVAASKKFSYHWVINDTETQNARKFTYDLDEDAAPGDTVKVRVTVGYGDGNSCVDSYAVDVILDFSDVVAIGANKSAKLSEGCNFKLYPNPVKGMFNVQMAGDGVYRVSVYNKRGVLLLTQSGEGSSAKIDVASLNADIYVCVVEQDGEATGRTFTIKK